MHKSLYPDVLSLIKKETGEQIDNIRAMVGDNGIVTYDAEFDLDPGDIFIRTRPTGTKEKYRVLSPGYKPPFSAIQAHYQAGVEMMGALRREPANQASNIVVSGDNARLNINSTDSSTNTVIHSESDSELFQNLINAADVIIDGVVRAKVLESIAQMSQSTGDKKTFVEKYNSFIASAANHMTVFLPFMPALTKFLSGM